MMGIGSCMPASVHPHPFNQASMPSSGGGGGCGAVGNVDVAGYVAAARRAEDVDSGGRDEHDGAGRREGGRGGKAGRRGPSIEDPKRLAADFAAAVTTQSTRGGDWVARNGEESLFSTLRKILPQVHPACCCVRKLCLEKYLHIQSVACFK